MKEPEDILQFWFSERVQKYWFKSTDAFDAEIRREFEITAMGLAADMSASNAAHPWEALGASAHLSLIIALDQFSRNMYRNTPAAFAWDRFALASAKRLIEKKNDLHLSQTQRPFAYMPFMHSEILEDQKTCEHLCDSRLDDENTLKFAIIHREIIERFGRFPHRNEILNRETSSEEFAFLESGGFSG